VRSRPASRSSMQGSSSASPGDAEPRRAPKNSTSSIFIWILCIFHCLPRSGARP
jgi:hypothetical protein